MAGSPHNVRNWYLLAVNIGKAEISRWSWYMKAGMEVWGLLSLSFAIHVGTVINKCQHVIIKYWETQDKS